MPKITPFLWFDGNAEEAVAFYLSVFKNAKILRRARYGEAGKEQHERPPGSIMTIEFELNGQNFVALNGGPSFKFNEAVSFVVNCDTQEELDYYWGKLSEGGPVEAQMCGWLKDKFGLSWQIVPAELEELIQEKDPEKSNRVMGALMQMTKLDIATLRKAAAAS
ncbi:MAG TPA: VOC family protein [Verrucomicrobiales bacterium]|jgi:predicted 3-demethylubiquinone-9 3-methyltransferase (glyoxalase superfamily)|nr:VOC family protein [Verrucomicrobiales bacterium]